MTRREIIKLLKREINRRNNGVKLKNSDIYVQDIQQIEQIEQWKLVKAIEDELERQNKVF